MPSQSICPFNFNILGDTSHNTWFLPRKQSGSFRHVGHFKIEPQHVRLASKHSLSDPEQQLSLDCYDTGIDNTSTAALIEQRTGSLVGWDQLRYMKNNHKNLMLTDNATDNETTPADCLVRQLSRDPSESFVALFAEFHSGLVTIKTRSKRQNNSDVMSDFNHDLQDDTDNPIAFAQSLRKRLQASSSGKILLMIAWTSDHSRLQFDKFSEFCGIDDTAETNSEERPLLTVVGRCNQNHIFDILRAFMPSTAKWAYNFLFHYAFPQLHPGTALSRLSHIRTDACAQQISSLENTITLARAQKITSAERPGGYADYIPWSNAENAYCAWHLIDRDFLSDSKYKASICEAKSDSILTRVEIDIIVRWMWYLVKYYVSDEEVEFSFNLLSWYISTEDQSFHFGKLKSATRSKIKEFLVKSFYLKRHKLFEPYMNGTTLYDCTSSGNESEHSATKRNTLGPKPCHDIAESARRIDQVSKRREDKKINQTCYDVNAQFTKQDDRHSNVDGLTDYINDILNDEYDIASKHLLRRHSAFIFHVKNDYDQHENLFGKICI
ncbi:hypothetical protein ACHAWF_012377 [Thalassiosira exigua]